MFWPYMFHLPGVVFLACAYLFYDRDRWGAWALGLVLFASMKEDFGVMAAAFAAQVFCEHFRDRRARVRLGMWVAAAGIGIYAAFGRSADAVIHFSDRFGNLRDPRL